MKLKRVGVMSAVIREMGCRAFLGARIIGSLLPKTEIVRSGLAAEVPGLAGADILFRSVTDGRWYALIDKKIYGADAELGSRLGREEGVIGFAAS